MRLKDNKKSPQELTRHIGAGTLTLEAMDKELQTPLFYAIKHNKSQCLRFLLTQVSFKDSLIFTFTSLSLIVQLEYCLQY